MRDFKKDIRFHKVWLLINDFDPFHPFVLSYDLLPFQRCGTLWTLYHFTV